MDCLFCKIVNKEIPADVVYEDDKILAFLDIHPVNAGHTLVVPKAHSTTLVQATDEDLTALTLAVKKLAPAVCVAVACGGWNLQVNNGNAAGQVVDHTHWHIVPRYDGDGLEHWPKKPYAEGEAAAVAEKIRDQIK